jgi:hypothetical protein
MLPVVGQGFYLAINTSELPEIMKHADNSRGPDITAHGSLDLKQEIQIQLPITDLFAPISHKVIFK